jgi:hypothetical protein
LEVRDTLSSRDASESLVILTPLGHDDLLEDVTARLVRRRVLEVDAWEPVLRAFGAQRMDARLAGHSWLSDTLLAGVPPEGYPKVPSGTLDVATAWQYALRTLLGADAGTLDLTTLCEWTLDASVLSRWTALPRDQASDIGNWIRARVGAASELPLALVASGHGTDVIPAAIVCGVLFDDADEPPGVRGAAAIRLERWTNGVRIDAGRGRLLLDAADRLLMRLRGGGQASAVSNMVSRADDLLGELGASSEAWRSRWLPKGFEQRVERYAHSLMAALDGTDTVAAVSAATSALGVVRSHTRAQDDPERLVRAEQALRLVRYVFLVESEPLSFAEAVAAYVTGHAFADVARYSLYASETHPALGAALAAVAERAGQVRETFTTVFASLARSWLEAPSPAPRLIPIEQALTSVVAPLGACAPVLLVVVDGMSAAVADSLGRSIERRGWTRIGSPEIPAATALVGALPSVTEVCRTSLLCGELSRGTAADERSGFSRHARLLALSKPDYSPRLFHKSDLGAAAALADDVGAAVAQPDQRVVGVVVNAVDDHLLKDDMVRPVWTSDYVPIIGALCDAARAAGRCLVFVSDHGHVLDLKRTEKRPGGESDRYRPSGSPVLEGELLVTGARVVTDNHTVVVAASERVRYASRKNGYHGGISPQEIVIPLMMFAPEGRTPAGYHEVAYSRPAWWDLEAALAEAPASVAPVPAPTGLPLFDRPLFPAPAAAVVTAPSQPSWVARLFQSDVWKEQQQRATRAALPEDRMRSLLVALVSRGGRMTTAALADRLAIPAGRVPSTVAAAAQVLNFDGYQVLCRDGDDVVFDEALLLTQFELEA